MNYKDVLEMPNDLFLQFWNSITVIEARDMLSQMTIGDYPQMKKENRTSIHKKIYKLAYPKMFDPEKKEQNIKDAFKALTGALNG